MDKKWKTAQKEKTLREGLTSMLCFQMALCLAAAGVFFAAVRLGGENEEAAKKTARLLCQEQPLSVDTENMEQLWQQFFHHHFLLFTSPRNRHTAAGTHQAALPA